MGQLPHYYYKYNASLPPRTRKMFIVVLPITKNRANISDKLLLLPNMYSLETKIRGYILLSPQF